MPCSVLCCSVLTESDTVLEELSDPMLNILAEEEWPEVVSAAKVKATEEEWIKIV